MGCGCRNKETTQAAVAEKQKQAEAGRTPRTSKIAEARAKQAARANARR